MVTPKPSQSATEKSLTLPTGANDMGDHDKLGDLRPNRVDYSVAGVRGVVNLVPIVGPFLAEIFGVTIPKQRIDRVAKFATELNHRLETIENYLLERGERAEDEGFIDLLEEGFQQASRALSDERRIYIASLIVNGLTSDGIEFSESKHLLRVLGEINDVEVVWLRFFKVSTIGGDQEFREIHEGVLAPVIPFMGSSQETIDKSALQKSYKEHLAQLGLLDRRYKTDMQTRTPEFRQIYRGNGSVGIPNNETREAPSQRNRTG